MPIDMSNVKFFSPTSDPKIDWEHVDQEALEMLDAAREIADTPFRITSNYRSPEYSASIGGSNTDAHAENPCTAFDIAYSDTLQLFNIITSLISVGFDRIGVNPFNHHVHVDHSMKLPTPRIWIETPTKLLVRALEKQGYIVTKPEAPPLPRA